VAGLPQLQDAVFGSAVIGYGDLFIAGALGGLLAANLGRRSQLHAALLTSAFALAFDLLFFFVDELPATVPVALALIVTALTRRARSSAAAETRTPPVPGVPRAVADPQRPPRASASP
jgi:hypothetical protein